MGVVWVLEKPGRHEPLIALLYGDFPVRAFASTKSFLKLGRLSQLPPQAVVIAYEDFAEDAEILETVIRAHWPDSHVLWVGTAPENARGLPLAEIRELPFVMQRLLRQGGNDSESTRYMELGDLCLDFEGNRIRVLPHGDWLHLTRKEAQILRHLIRFQSRFLSHEDLCEEIWKDVKVSPKSVSAHMSRIRRYLSHSNFTIESIYGGGYRLVQQA